MLVAHNPALVAFDLPPTRVARTAKYRIEKICAGTYDRKEIVVDHLIFTLKEFDNIKIGDRVCVTVKVSKQIHQRNNAEGIRGQDEAVSMFYVASEAPVGVSASSDHCPKSHD